MSAWTATPARPKPLILHIDDEYSMHNMINSMLAAADCDVKEAYNGLDGIAAAVKENPDLIILDITMPQLDGIETCQRLRANPATKKIPIIMLTGMDTVRDVDRAIDAGADAYLLKPVELRRLHEKLKEFLNRT